MADFIFNFKKNIDPPAEPYWPENPDESDGPGGGSGDGGRPADPIWGFGGGGGLGGGGGGGGGGGENVPRWEDDPAEPDEPDEPDEPYWADPERNIPAELRTAVSRQKQYVQAEFIPEQELKLENGGLRADGKTAAGPGWRGIIPLGGEEPIYMTERSEYVMIEEENERGERVMVRHLIPMIVPITTDEEIEAMIGGTVPGSARFKAILWAAHRIRNGLPLFYDGTAAHRISRVLYEIPSDLEINGHLLTDERSCLRGTLPCPMVPILGMINQEFPEEEVQGKKKDPWDHRYCLIFRSSDKIVWRLVDLKTDFLTERFHFAGFFDWTRVRDLTIAVKWQSGHYDIAENNAVRLVIFGIDLGWVTIPLKSDYTELATVMIREDSVTVNSLKADLTGNMKYLTR